MVREHWQARSGAPAASFWSRRLRTFQAPAPAPSFCSRAPNATRTRRKMQLPRRAHGFSPRATPANRSRYRRLCAPNSCNATIRWPCSIARRLRHRPGTTVLAAARALHGNIAGIVELSMLGRDPRGRAPREILDRQVARCVSLGKPVRSLRHARPGYADLDRDRRRRDRAPARGGAPDSAHAARSRRRGGLGIRARGGQRVSRHSSCACWTSPRPTARRRSRTSLADAILHPDAEDEAILTPFGRYVVRVDAQPLARLRAEGAAAARETTTLEIAVPGTIEESRLDPPAAAQARRRRNRDRRARRRTQFPRRHVRHGAAQRRGAGERLRRPHARHGACGRGCAQPAPGSRRSRRATASWRSPARASARACHARERRSENARRPGRSRPGPPFRSPS